MDNDELSTNAEKLINQISMCGLLARANSPLNKDAQRDDYMGYAKATVVTFIEDLLAPKWQPIDTVPFENEWEGGAIYKEQAFYADKDGNVILRGSLRKPKNDKTIGFLGFEFTPKYWMPLEMPNPPLKKKGK